MYRKVLILLAASVAACSKSSDHGAAGSGPAVVTFGDHVITAEQFQKELSQQSPFIRSRYQSVEKKKEFLDGIVRLDLLSDEAKKAGFDQDPDVQREFKKAMVQRWMREKFNDKEGMANLPAADVQAYYDAHKDDYQRPERLRLQLIAFKAPAGDGKVKAEAAKDLKDIQAKMKKNDVSAFAELARTRSDDATSKLRGGDLDFHTHDEIVKLFGDDVASAADALKAPNDLSDVVAGKDGFYLLRLEARQPAFNRSLEQVKSTLQARLWNERRNQMFEDFVKQLREKANVKVDEAELAKIDANKPDLSAQASASPMAPAVPPGPGAQPPPAPPHPPMAAPGPGPVMARPPMPMAPPLAPAAVPGAVGQPSAPVPAAAAPATPAPAP